MKYSWSLALCLFTVSLLAQNDPNEKKLFNQALQAYQAHRYDESLHSLQNLLEQYPSGSYTSASLLLLSKTYSQTGLMQRSAQTASLLLEKFPKSDYRDDALLQLAQADYESRQYESAIKKLTEIKNSKNKQASEEAALILDQMIQYSLSSQEIAPLVSTNNDLQLFYARKLISIERYRKASSILEEFIKLNPKHDDIKIAKALLKEADEKNDGPVVIGLIVSLSGPYAEIGKSVKNGVELAIAKYNESNKIKIELITYDDRSDIVQCIKAAQALTDNPSISLIIGPAESTMMAAAAVVANFRHMPMISPTATQSDLTDIGAYIYQANVDVETRSRAIARYAVQKMGLKKFAILAPSDAYGETATTSFSAAVESFGGHVVVSQKFYDNTQDYRAQITTIRKLGLIDQVNGAISKGVWSIQQIDSIYNRYFPVDPDNPEDFKTPLTNIDAVFLPIYSDDIKYIAPQLAFYNIKTQLLGGDNWYDLTELKLQQNYVNGAIFISEYFVNNGETRTKNFLQAYRQKFGYDAGREGVYGYDLMELISEIIKKGNYLSEDIQAELEKGIEWNGIHNTIRFSKDSRANTSVHLLQFQSGAVSKLKE
ncbi:ABC transporter substrate-binding protein [bacterium]|nr:ABC transporter substrate-binding protein [bacterium]